MIKPLNGIGLVFFLILGYAHDATADPKPDPKQFVVWGPGIERPELVVPVRYFYVQTVDGDGVNITKSLSPRYIKARIDGKPAPGEKIQECRAAVSVIDRSDGSYIVQYKLITSCHRLIVVIETERGELVGRSPYSFYGAQDRPILRDGCQCPVPVADWMKMAGCGLDPEDYPAVQSDLATWPPGSVNFTLALEDAFQRWGTNPGGNSYCHYGIKAGLLYRTCYGEHVGFKMFGDSMLLSLLRKVRLPDMQFLLNLGDWPLETVRRKRNMLVPMVSWGGSEDSKDIVLPTYEIMEATLEMMGRQSLDMLSVQGMTTVPWEDKIGKAFFRGRDSCRERLAAANLSVAHPDLLDAKITRFFFFRDVMETFGNGTANIPFGDFFEYKYQLNIDGTVAAYRFPFLLAGNSLVLKQDSPYYEHFYSDLQPGDHYLPVKRDLSDLIQQIRFAKTHESLVLAMIKKAQNYARDKLDPISIFCYHIAVFKEYVKILDDNSRSNIDVSSMEHVPFDEVSPRGCRCSVSENKEEL